MQGPSSHGRQGTGSTEAPARKRKGGRPRTAPPQHLLYMAKAGLLLCLRPGNLLGKPDTRAWRGAGRGVRGSRAPDPGCTSSQLTRPTPRAPTAIYPHSEQKPISGALGTVTAVQITPLQRHGSGSLGSASPGARPVPALPGLAHHSRRRPGPRRTKLGSSDCSPFFRRNKFQFTSLEAGLGPEPSNAPGSPVLTHSSHWAGWQQERTELPGAPGSPGPAPLLQPSPAGAPCVLR